MNELKNIESIEKIKYELSKIDDNAKQKRVTRFIVSALGSIPWIGGFFGASSTLSAEIEQGKVNDLHQLWIKEHQRKIDELTFTLFQIVEKLESSEVDISERIESPEYLNLVRKGFKEWDNAETSEKKEYIRKLLTNACTSSLSTDDLIRLYIDWIKQYNELHFLIIKEIYKSTGITRGEIWNNLNPTNPKENSIEADLYSLIFRDLSTGGIVRQHRETDYYGNFIKKTTRKPKSATYKSVFDNTDQYELTELGKQFVHYTMTEVVTKIEDKK